MIALVALEKGIFLDLALHVSLTNLSITGQDPYLGPSWQLYLPTNDAMLIMAANGTKESGVMCSNTLVENYSCKKSGRYYSGRSHGGTPDDVYLSVAVLGSGAWASG